MKLINKYVSWYSLLITIDFKAGDTLPFYTKLFCLPEISPDVVVNSNLQSQTSQPVKTLGGKISATEAAPLGKLETDKAKEAICVEAALKKVAEEQAVKKAEQEQAELKRKRR